MRLLTAQEVALLTPEQKAQMLVEIREAMRNMAFIRTSYERFKVHMNGAVLGDADAMAFAGEYLLDGGEGYPKNPQEGVRWIRKAAALGSAEARTALEYAKALGFITSTADTGAKPILLSDDLRELQFRT